MIINIAIADDHPLVINGLRHILDNTTDMKIVGSYNNGAELLAGIAINEPDVLLLDIQMPGKTGDELAAIIYHTHPNVKMIALTNQDDVFYIRSMLSKGVHGYLLKTTPDEVLLEAIRTVHRGDKYLESALKEKMTAHSIQERKQATAAPILSRREKEILQLIATELTSQQIAEKLFISKRTIDNHRLNLLTKLGVKNVVSLVKKAVQLGLLN